MTHCFSIATRVHGSRVLAGLLFLWLGACQSPFNGADDALSVQDRFPITVDSQLISQEFSIGPSTFALDQTSKASTEALIEHYKARGVGKFNIANPVGSPNAAAAIQIAAEMTEIAKARGVDPRNVDVVGYTADKNQPRSPMVVSFTVHRAVTSECGRFTSGMGFAPLNKPTPNFGCATQNNLAALVEEPGDFANPRTMGPSDQARRRTTLEKYRSGEVTAAKKEDDALGKVSEVSQ